MGGGAILNLDLQRIRREPEGTVLVVGDVMLDQYDTCAEEYSYNEGTQLLRVKESEYFPGGAANVALNLVELGSRVCLVGITGNDDAARKLNKLLDHKVTNMLMAVDSEVTCVKNRFSTRYRRNMLKIERRGGATYGDEIYRTLLEQTASVLYEVNLVIISDYGLGVVDERLVSEIIALAKREGKPVYVDPRGNHAGKYRGASALTPNLNEFNLLTGQTYTTWKEAIPHGRKLLEDHDVSHIVLKDGDRGSVLIGEKEVLYCPPLAKSKDLVCTIGAGDSLLAAMAFGHMNGLDYGRSFLLGNLAAAFAISKVFTSVVGLEEIIRWLGDEDPIDRLQRI